MENTDTVASATAPSLGRAVVKLVFGTAAGIVASALVEHGIDAVAKRRQKTTDDK